MEPLGGSRVGWERNEVWRDVGANSNDNKEKQCCLTTIRLYYTKTDPLTAMPIYKYS